MKPQNETKTKRTYNRKKPIEKANEPIEIKSIVVNHDPTPIEPVVYGIWVTNHNDRNLDGWVHYGSIVFHTTYKCVANAQLYNLNLVTSSYRSYEVKEMK